MQPRYNIEKSLKHWQKRLGLENWDIKIEWLKDSEPVSEAYACVFVDTNHRVARAQITPEERLESPDILPAGHASCVRYNPEQSIVHELLHVMFYEYGIGLLENSDLASIQLERYINKIAETLIAVRITGEQDATLHVDAVKVLRKEPELAKVDLEEASKEREVVKDSEETDSKGDRDASDVEAEVRVQEEAPIRAYPPCTTGCMCEDNPYGMSIKDLKEVKDAKARPRNGGGDDDGEGEGSETEPYWNRIRERPF